MAVKFGSAWKLGLSEAPTFKLQAPEKHQASSSKLRRNYD
jgi:hypothetical protein